MQNGSLVTVAASQYPVEFIGSWTSYVQKVTRLVDHAVGQGAQLLLFPEYACMELASLFPPHIYRDLHGQLVALQTLLGQFRQLHSDLAQHYGIYIVSPSFPVRLADGSYRNRAYFFAPDGAVDYQDKLIMTRFEREQWRISPGDEIKVFATEFGYVGITICYDSEFPLIARRQAELGAQLILAPSCTDTMAGYHRVRIGSQARALENQCYVVTAPLVGTVDWSEAIDVNVGAATVFTPVDYGFPDDGVLAKGELNAAQWVIAELDLAKVAAVRQHGQVTNYSDWDHQWPLMTSPALTPGWLTPVLVTTLMHEKAHRSTAPAHRMQETQQLRRAA